MPQLLKPTCLEPVLRNKRSHRNEKPVHHNEEWPRLSAAGEGLHAAMKDSRQPKIKVNKINTLKKHTLYKWGLIKDKEKRSVFKQNSNDAHSPLRI